MPSQFVEEIFVADAVQLPGRDVRATAVSAHETKSLRVVAVRDSPSARIDDTKIEPQPVGTPVDRCGRGVRLMRRDRVGQWFVPARCQVAALRVDER